MGRRLVVFLVLLALWTAPLADVSEPVGSGLGEGIAPFDLVEYWYDSLDDSSHVYVPESGLVGVEVSGGDVHLLPGTSAGWVASTVIGRIEGLRYDYVLLEVDTPGNSSVQVSIVDALKDSTKVGFVNETIPGYEKVKRSTVSLFSVDPLAYPAIRIQVDLIADGDDAPRLLSWSLYYCDDDLWYDSFIGLGREAYCGDLSIGNGTVKPVIPFVAGGVLGEYYDNKDLTGFMYEKNNDIIDYNWGSGAPAGLGSNTFSIRWTGKFLAKAVETHTFYLHSDDGARLWIDGRLLIDKWVDQSPTEHTANIDLEPGLHDLKVEYYENTISAQCQLRYSTPSISKQIVPREVLYEKGTSDLVSETITLPSGYRWDILKVDRILGTHGEILIDVMDPVSNTSIPGYRDLLVDDVDLSDLNPVIYPSLRLKARWNIDNVSGAPALSHWMVKWVERGTWREQFYGRAKVDRTFNFDLVDDKLSRTATTGKSPQILVASLRRDEGYDTRSVAYFDSGGVNYTTLPPIPLNVVGASAVDAVDVDGDGYLDVAFAVRQTGDTSFAGFSPLFLGSAVGWRDAPAHTFRTTGASDVLLRDLNGDGRVDVAFAQEYDGASHRVNSTLFWGKVGGGWNATPDVEFETNGASGLVAADLDGDGRLDLAFSCYMDASTTTTDSMVFLQDANGFCGTVPSHKLPTRGARAVAAGDVDRDGRMDLAFANSIWQGLAEVNSSIFLGKAGGGFEQTPIAILTSGANDLELADVDGDGDLDVVSANMRNNMAIHRVDSYVYLNDGSGGFPASPSARLPTTGAVAVAVADLDGTGRKDLLFACHYNGTSHAVPSVVYLGGATGWSTTPDMVLPTAGASDVLVAHLIGEGQGGYMSRAITPEDPRDTGTFHTFRYTAALGAQQAGYVKLVDASTWEVLAETPLRSGANEWLVKDTFQVKDNPSIRVVVVVSGLDAPGEFTLDDLWLNWTPRVKLPPQVLGIDMMPAELFRLDRGELVVNLSDEYDDAMSMKPVVEHRLNGSTDAWTMSMVGPPEWSEVAWRLNVLPRADASLGSYDFRVSVRDSDGNSSGYVLFPNALGVLNNVPTAPTVLIMPQSPTTTVSLRAEIMTPATDRETPIAYRYAWFCDGALMETLTSDVVSSSLTARGQNWSVELRANDGIEEGPPGIAWVVIANAPPGVGVPLPNPAIEEDTVDDQWLNLFVGFTDPDGDVLTYTLDSAPEGIDVTIAPDGRVTLKPEANWYGEGTATFTASDGELTASQTVLITVTPVNDAPWFTAVNGGPITSDPMNFEVPQGGLLVITVGTEDVEGDELVFSVNTSAVQVDSATGEMRFQPGVDAIGTIRYAITMYDVATPTVKVRLNFTITVINVNDPPGEARITNPRSGDQFRVNTTFSLLGACEDPDTVLGQVLNYTWWWNDTHLLGYGSSLTVSFDTAGNYSITLNVTDGEFFREASVAVEILPREVPAPPPPPPPPPEEEGPGAVLWIGILVALVIVGGVIFLVVSRRRAAEKEAADEEEEKREAFKKMAVAVKETAEQMEREVAESRAEKATAPQAAPATPAAAKVTEYEEIKDEDIVVEGVGSPAERSGLSMEPKVTEEAYEEVRALFEGADATAVPPAEDAEALRLENLKRKYQTAISRLPYGIPAEALKEKEWTWLAGALATGEKKTLPDGREVTQIEGRWYYSDVKDASSFLKEYGAKPRAEARKPVEVTTDKATLLAKLEERFIRGEISEMSYRQLKDKYEDKD